MIKTIRHGEDDTLALMGRQSLTSDLDSLERMVADFGRDVYSYNDDQMRSVACRVKEGDLSDVMRVWENEIKVGPIITLYAFDTDLPLASPPLSLLLLDPSCECYSFKYKR